MVYASGESLMVGDVVECVSEWGSNAWRVIPGDRRTVGKIDFDGRGFEDASLGYKYYASDFRLVCRKNGEPQSSGPVLDDQQTIIEARRRAAELRDWFKVQELSHPWDVQAFRNNIARLDGVVGDLGVSLARFGKRDESMVTE